MANNPYSLREGLTDDAKILFDSLIQGQNLTNQRLDDIYRILIKNHSTTIGRLNVMIQTLSNLSIGGGGVITPPDAGDIIDDLTDLQSEIHVNIEEVLTESADASVATYFTKYAPIIYGSFKLKADGTNVPTTDYEVQYTTGQIKLLNPAALAGKRLTVDYNNEVVYVEDQPLTAIDAVNFIYEAPYTSIIEDTVIVSNTKGTAIMPISVDSRSGKIKVDGSKYDDVETTVASFKVVLPLGYSRIVGTSDAGNQITHLFTSDYAALFTAITDTQGDNGELSANHNSQTSVLKNTGEEGLDVSYAVVHDSTGRIYIGDGNYNSVTGINLTHNLGTSAFKAFVITSNNTTEGYIGEVWVEQKADQSLKVFNSGSDAATAFKYVVIKNSVGKETGSGNFAEGGTTVTHNLALGEDYSVLIQPTQNPNGHLGDVWVDIAHDSFTVHHTGDWTGTFDYLIIEN